MKGSYWIITLIVLFMASPTHSQIPVLRVNGQSESQEVYLHSLDIHVKVTGNIAATEFTMVFKNRTGKILEGELVFPLPDGVTVSQYALDINGKMREAVPVEKAKATQVFEEIEQRQVDPGLLERVEGNNFRTRIYPIPAHGSRTITIGYEEELKVENNTLKYQLPMDYKAKIEKFDLKATVWQSVEKPIVEAGNNELVFDRAGNNYVSTFSRKDYQPSSLLSFSLPVRKDIPQVWMQAASGSYYFLASCFPEITKTKKNWPDRMAIIWDVSLSGLQRNTEKELELLDDLFREKKNLTVSLFLLNNRFSKQASYTISNGNWEELRHVLTSLIYDGGTNYSAIPLHTISENEILFFSDGLSTLSDADFIKRNPSGKTVHCIVSSPKADYSATKWIAAQTGGKFFNLNALSDTRIKDELLYETLHFLGTEHAGNIRETYPSVATPVQSNFSVAGILEAPQGEITFLFGKGNKVEKRMKVQLNAANAAQQGNIYRIWAQKKITELDMNFTENREELTELGKEFGIVTRNTSLMVLETIDDYIRYNIEPPVELQAEYLQWKKNRQEKQERNQQALLNNAIATAEELKQWWEKDFKVIPSRYPKPDNRETAMAVVPPAVSEEVMEIMQLSDEMTTIAEMAAVDEVIVSRSEARLAGSADRVSVEREEMIPSSPPSGERSQPVIRLMQIKQDNQYSNRLTGQADADYEIYLNIRSEYIGTPTFYFDMADWFYKLNDKERALRILTSVAELDIENASLYRLLAYRLKEYQEYALEAYICKKVIEWRPMEPQSYRDYALALADNKNYQESLNSLYQVLTQSYATHITQRSAGIEEVVVTELNRLIAKNRLNTAGIDKKLIKEMPVDIRVVINWNMNNTDIDLHVKDPKGEICYYRNRETAMGGRISKDITQGYGPEQFMLKKAIQGKYEVFVNYFGDSQVKAEGPSTVILEIYTKYADKVREERQVVCLQLSKEQKKSENGLVKVAEFEF